MSTPSGKPINPLDLSAYVSQKAREQANTERFPVENADDLFRSPYAPKRAEAGTTPQPVENTAEVLRSPYAPKTQQQMRPAPELGDLAGHAEDLHAPEGSRGPAAVERHPLGFEETQRQSYDAPAGATPPPPRGRSPAFRAVPISRRTWRSRRS
jgi:hypothetical protein